MNDVTRFWLLLSLFILSLALLYVLNSNLGQQLLIR